MTHLALEVERPRHGWDNQTGTGEWVAVENLDWTGTLTFASWNHIGRWLQRLDALRRVA